MTYTVEISHTFLSLVERIADKRIQSKIIDRIKALKEDPEKQGKRLVRNLAGLRSIHVAGRYRAIYKMDKNSKTVWVLAAGIRKEGDQKDIYQIARKLLRLGLLGPGE